MLRALSEKEKFSSSFRSIAINGGFYEKGELKTQWDLSKSLSGQSEKTINFLLNLLI